MTQQPNTHDLNEPRRKRIWNWWKLVVAPFIVAASVAGIGIWFNGQQNDVNTRLSQDQQRETTLENYLNSMTDLLLKQNLQNAKQGSAVVEAARARTLTALRVLDGERKGSLLQFLNEAQLISQPNSVIFLNGADLHEANLQNAGLYNADLSGSDLHGANLQGANLSSAWLNGVNLNEADLRNAQMSQAVLDSAHLNNAELCHADLTGARLFGADLSKAHLEYARMGTAQLNGAHLNEAHLDNAGLSGAHLDGAHLDNASLTHSYLIEATLRKAILIGMDLSNTDLSGADLSSADLHGANLSDARLFDNGLNSATISQKQLDSTSCLQGVVLPGGQIVNKTCEDDSLISVAPTPPPSSLAPEDALP